MRFGLDGWTIHFHANGHNWKDWSIALVCGVIGRLRGRSILTLHSGLTPDYLGSASSVMRMIMKWTCLLHARVICVSEPIRNSLKSIGARGEVEVAEACLGVGGDFTNLLDASLTEWLQDHQPFLTTALLFRAEYGFETLVTALARLRHRYPTIGCIVMGGGDEQGAAQKLVRDAGIDGNVLLSGDVEHDVCLTLISRSDVFVRGTLCDGDSISVREALALGVPVAASRTAFRPKGVTLFEPGDVDGMVSAIEAALRSNTGAVTAAPGTGDQLMAIYRHATAAEVA
ncbi:MAG TPA: glycosyltransferase [Bryobacteraceae bacterium]|nr:glycosyltransferase [Bryobacteraceae bacterium]